MPHHAKVDRRRFIHLATVTAGGALLAGNGLPPAPAYANMTPALWRDDLRFLYEGMQKRHRDLFHHTPKAEFDLAFSGLEGRLPDLNAIETVAALQCFVALAGDGHTFLFTWDRYRNYPFEVAWFPDGVRIVRTTRGLAHLLGMRVERIDGRSIADVERFLAPAIPGAENEWYVLAQRPEKLRRSELLAALGVTDRPDRIRLRGTLRSGKTGEFVVEPLPYGTSDDVLSEVAGPTVPVTPDPFFAWRWMPEENAVHLNFREYGDLVRKADVFFQEVRQRKPDKLIIDLRQNGGGNYTLPRDHLIAPIQNIPEFNRIGHLYLLIGRNTFSAAMTNASDFRRETEAVLVGEPTGARPNGFQELSSFTLPNCGIGIACSIRRYRFESDGRDAVYPDVMAPPDWAMMAAGRDPAIEAALEHARRHT